MTSSNSKKQTLIGYCYGLIQVLVPVSVYVNKYVIIFKDCKSKLRNHLFVLGDPNTLVWFCFCLTIHWMDTFLAKTEPSDQHLPIFLHGKVRTGDGCKPLFLISPTFPKFKMHNTQPIDLMHLAIFLVITLLQPKPRFRKSGLAPLTTFSTFQIQKELCWHHGSFGIWKLKNIDFQ